MPAGDFLKAVWNKVTGDDNAAKSAEAASAAAKSASEAATAAQNKPNVTITNTYHVPVTAPQNADPTQMQTFVTKAMQDFQRRQDSTRRSSFSDPLGY